MAARRSGWLVLAVTLCILLCWVYWPSSKQCTNGGSSRTVAKVVDVLKSVKDFGGLADYLYMGDDTDDIEMYCGDSQPKARAECSRRELVLRYCRGRGLHQTIADIANVLEHDMTRKRQADALREILESNRPSVWSTWWIIPAVAAVMIYFLWRAAPPLLRVYTTLPFCFKSVYNRIWLGLILLIGLSMVITSMWPLQEDGTGVFTMPSSPSIPWYTSAHQALITFPVKSTSSTPTAPSPVFSKYARYLKSKYKKYLGSIPGKLVLTLGKEYVPLTLVKYEIDTQEKAEEFFLKIRSGDVDQIRAEKDEIKIRDIFKPGENIRLVVVEGEPGIGKSTLALELCHQWQNGSLLQHFSIVLLLKLREESVRSAKHIRDLFFHPDDKIRDKLLEEMNENLGEGVLIIFDGFDELPVELRKKSLISDLINSPDNLSEATIMVTTRHSASDDLQRALKTVTNKCFVIVGFTNRSIDEAASKVLKVSDLVLKFSKYVSGNPIIKFIMHNPLTCAIVLNVYKQNSKTGRPIPHTQTQLYTELSRYLISSYLSEKQDPLAEALPEKLEDFPNKLYFQLLQIGELAYNGILKSKEIFEQLLGNSTGLGLLIEYDSLFSVNKTVKFSFYHTSLQEYMSAFYLSEGGKIRELEDNSFKISLEIVKFVAGFTKMKKFGWDEFFKSHYFMSQSGKRLEVHLLTITCLYETQNSDSCKLFDAHEFEVLEFRDIDILTKFDMFSLGYTIGLCGWSWNLILSKATVPGLEMLNRGLEYNPYGEGSINKLILDSSSGILTQGDHLRQVPHHILQKIEILFLNGGNISQKGFENLAVHLPELSNLRALIIDSNPGGPGSLVNLMQSLKTHKKIEYLFIYKLEIGMKDISALSAMIKSSDSLTSLGVGEWLKSTPDIDTQLVRAVLSPSSLVNAEIYFKSNSYKDFCILECIDVVSNRLKSLTLRDMSQRRRFSTVKGTNFRIPLGKNTSLKHLQLLFNLNRNEIENILLWLEENNSLEMLHLLEDMRESISASQKALDTRISFTSYDHMTEFPLAQQWFEMAVRQTADI